MHPKKPNSSPNALKIKSVCCSGINCKFVSLPFNKPVPIRPPEPIAILPVSYTHLTLPTTPYV